MDETELFKSYTGNSNPIQIMVVLCLNYFVKM